MEADLKNLEAWIFKELRIDLSAYKSTQMTRRLNNLISRTGSSSVNEYIRMLDKSPEQRQRLADFITINVSEFFRNKELFLDLEDKIKTCLVKGNKRLKMWSAACSNGAEPYSIAIIMDKLTPGTTHTILATDIDSTILETAKRGEYGPGDIKNVDKAVLDKYFKAEDGKYFLSASIKNRVEFKKHDLILDEYPKGFDLIICRNVVIYFTQDVKDKIYKRFYGSLNPGGLLFVGATEGIYNYRDFGFEKASTFIYQKRV